MLYASLLMLHAIASHPQLLSAVLLGKLASSNQRCSVSTTGKALTSGIAAGNVMTHRQTNALQGLAMRPHLLKAARLVKIVTSNHKLHLVVTELAIYICRVKCVQPCLQA